MKTGLYALIGFPVKHTFSPPMHNAAFSALGMNAAYFALEVKPEYLKDALEGIKGLGLCGFNVTIPHKESCMKYLDGIDPLAKSIGAVNTIVIRQGKLFGYNTDGLGFLQSLKADLKFNPKGKSVLLIGAGGAGRAVAFTLIKSGARSITVYDKQSRRAGKLVKALGKKAVYSASLPNRTYNLIVNASPCGMNKKDPISVAPKLLRKGTVVYDVIYNPLKTKLIKTASGKGLKSANGLGMLLYQGVIAFKLMTGKTPQVSVMRKALKRQI